MLKIRVIFAGVYVLFCGSWMTAFYKYDIKEPLADIEDDISVPEPRKGSEITYIPRPSSSDVSSSESESASETDVSNHTEGDE